MVGPILGGSLDVALSADVAPLSDSHFDGCDLLQRSVVHYGACKVLATIEIQHMSRECNERMWNLAYRLAQLRGASKLPGYRMAIAGVWCPQHRSLYSQEMLAEMIGDPA